MSICLKISSPEDFRNSFYEVDLDTATRTTVSYSVVDFLGLNKPQSFKSTQVVLAGSKKTNAALRNSFRVDIIDTSFEGKEVNCRLEYRGVDILRGTGKLIINSINFDSERNYFTYDCYMLGTRYNWIKTLVETTLCDIDLGTHVLSDQVIRNSWDRFGALGVPYDHSYIGCTYTPVHYGSWVDTTSGPNTSISSEDLYPSIYIYNIVKAIFSQLTDFSIESTFMESELFKGLVIPFTSKTGILTRELREAATVRVLNEGNPTNISSIGGKIISFPFFDYNYQEYKFDLWDGIRYKVKYSVKYRVEFNMHFEAGVGHTGVPDFRLFQDPTTKCSTTIDVSSDPTLSEDVVIVPGQKGRAKIVWETCLCGDTSKFTAGIKMLFTAGTPDFTILEDSSMVIFPISTTALNCPFPVQLASYLPCVSCKEFLDSLTQIFGLIWDTNESTKTIYVEPDKTFYRKSIHNDWSSKINNSRPISKEFRDRDSIKNIKYEYKEDSDDFWLKVEKEEQKDSPYSQIVIVNESSSEDPTVYTNTLFAASTSVKDHDTRGSAINPPEWIRMWKSVSTSTDPSYDYEPRIAYFGGLRSYTNCGFIFEKTQYPYFPHMWFINGYEGSDYSLAFNSTTEQGQYEDRGIVETFWDEFIRVSRIGVSIQVEVFLTERDITDLVFQQIVYVEHHLLGSGHYRVNNIREWDAEEGRALAQLVLISR